MDAETQTKVFDPFFTTKFTGRGLGMSAVLGIVRGHGGAITIQSEAGRGTTVRALFPPSDRQVASTAGEPEEDEAWGGAGTILLVDDEDSVLAVGKRVLEHVGFEVLTAADGRDAVDVFRARADEITCVILDLTMPHMDGEAALREIRRIKEDARVILASGYSAREVTTRFAGKGLAGFIQKPYSLGTLTAKVREVLARVGHVSDDVP